MSRYELVLLVDPQLKETERKEVLAEIEKSLSSYIKDKDDMGLQHLAFDIHGKKGQDKAYFMSFYLELEPVDLKKVREVLKYKKAILRNALFVFTGVEEYFHFDDLQKKLEKIIEGWSDKKFGQKVTFFTNPENQKYLNWKSVVMLKKYITRFGNIKPKAYTNNPVNKQKKLRRAILRARELGLIESVRK